MNQDSVRRLFFPCLWGIRNAGAGLPSLCPAGRDSSSTSRLSSCPRSSQFHLRLLLTPHCFWGWVHREAAPLPQGQSCGSRSRLGGEPGQAEGGGRRTGCSGCSPRLHRARAAPRGLAVWLSGPSKPEDALGGGSPCLW